VEAYKNQSGDRKKKMGIFLTSPASTEIMPQIRPQQFSDYCPLLTTQMVCGLKGILNAGWINSIRKCLMVLAVHRDRLENWFWALFRLKRPNYCPLTGHNPGSLLAFLLDITPWEDIYM